MTFDLNFFLRLFWLIPFIALLLAPLESVGWWEGWWFKEEDDPEDQMGAVHKPTSKSEFNHVVFYLTGIGGATETNDIPLEKKLLDALKETLPHTLVIDTIYPYSVINRSLTNNRPLARFWRYALQAKITGNKRVGFLINLRNLFQVFTAADDRYGTFFYQGTASVMIKKLVKAGYDPGSDVPISIIGYSGGGQVAVGAAPYIARVVAAPVTVVSLGGVLSSNPLIGRVDRIVHVVSNQDNVAKLGFVFTGRWPINFFSAWNRAKRKGRVHIRRLEGMQHDGPGGYLDAESFTREGQSFFDKTLATLGNILQEKPEPIPDDEGIDFMNWLNPNKRF